MDAGVALIFIFLMAGAGWGIARTASKKDPATQRKYAYLCIFLGFVCIPLELLSFYFAVTAPGGGDQRFVFGGELVYWYMAYRIFKMSSSATGVAFAMARENRADPAALAAYAQCLREDGTAPAEVLRAALAAFRQAGDHAMTAAAAEAMLRAEPGNASAQDALVAALRGQGKLKAAEDAAKAFAGQSPEAAERMSRALQELAAQRAAQQEKLPSRSLVDLAREAPENWTPLKAKRYAGQICKVLAELPRQGLPIAISPEDLALDEAQGLRFVPASSSRLRPAFTPPEGALLTAENPQPGLVYTAGRLMLYLFSGGRVTELPVIFCPTANQCLPAGPALAKEISCPTCGQTHKVLTADSIPLRKFNPNLGAGLEKAAQKACADAPGKRPKDLAELNRLIQQG